MASELMDEFIFDAREHLATAGTQLMELETEPDSLAKLNALMGTLHTIKGNSGFVNLKNLYGMLHGAENLLQTVRETEGHVCPPTTVNQLFQVLDAVEVILTRVEAGEDEDVDWLPTLNQAIAEEEAALERPNYAQESLAEAADAAQLSELAREEYLGAQDEAGAGPERTETIERAEKPDLFEEPEIMEPVVPSPEAAGGQDIRDQNVIEVLSDGQLGEKGQGYLRFLAKGEYFLVLDVNSLTSLSFDEIKLIREMVFLDDTHFVLVIDQDKHPDFWRVLVLWSLENKIRSYDDLERAKVDLGL
ncbi:MAG: Hpt domain-containing protein [Deltaproteobacteria bacterium]|jgi:chemotaxis protein histidine kinase CheA|nr:Hpt domain-containing protein [Deltaproteobacteria bacterium]